MKIHQTKDLKKKNLRLELRRHYLLEPSPSLLGWRDLGSWGFFFVVFWFGFFDLLGVFDLLFMYLRVSILLFIYEGAFVLRGFESSL